MMALRAAIPGQILASLVIGITALSACAALAQGVTVAPNRILLDGKTRSATVFLSNRGQEAETYRISLTFFRMEENGALVRVDSTTAEMEDTATEILRYSPRRVVIPAGGSQTVRLLVRRPPDLEPEHAEFRAHLSVCSVPTVPRLVEVETQLPEISDDQFIVRPVASVETLVPIIVRFGKPSADLAITEARIVQQDQDTGPVVAFNLERRGERSVYGDLTLTHVDAGGSQTQVYQARGLAVYTPNQRRTFEVRPQISAAALREGRLLIDFRETALGGGNLSVQTEIHASQLSSR